jgi:dTDP-glucose pyrophosphorylase
MKLALQPESKILDAVEFIELHRRTMAPIVDHNNILLGVVTDGDIRRALLKDTRLEEPILKIMNQDPVIGYEGDSPHDLKQKLIQRNLEELPIVDQDKKFITVFHVNSSFNEITSTDIKNFKSALILAGGEGRRLRPLTETTPKPMIEVGGMPLLERQIKTLASQGVEQVFISVNYLAEQIKEYFGNGNTFNVKIDYIHETTKLGTAGPLGLLKESLTHDDILVLNGDVLTTIYTPNLFSFHKTHDADISVAAIEHFVQIPYGVIRTNTEKITALEEKPSQTYLCNAGIYAISKKVLELVPHNEFYNMTSLIENCLTQSKSVVAFPLHEFWTDIGDHKELERARDMILKLENLNV